MMCVLLTLAVTYPLTKSLRIFSPHSLSTRQIIQWGVTLTIGTELPPSFEDYIVGRHLILYPQRNKTGSHGLSPLIICFILT